jgi:sugar/nucleoside kinase (ribokinase family)
VRRREAPLLTNDHCRRTQQSSNDSRAKEVGDGSQAQTGEQSVPKFDVSVIGELNLDLIFYGLPQHLELDREHLATNLSLTLGSSSAIFAHNLACLGSTVGFSSSIGSDALGEICIERLAEAKIDLARVRRFDGKITGLTVILPQGKERYILTYPGTMAEFSIADLDLSYVFDAKHLHVASYFLQRAIQPSLAEIFREAKAAGLTTSLDTNDDPENRWPPEIQKLFPHLDILMPNENEACRMAGVDDIEKAIDFLASKVKILVVKRGAKGALVCSAGNRFTAAPLSVEVIDAVGAGDSFNAGFLHKFVRGAKLEHCLAFGNVAAALSTTRGGGTEAFRDAAYRDAFLAKNAPHST